MEGLVDCFRHEFIVCLFLVGIVDLEGFPVCELKKKCVYVDDLSTFHVSKCDFFSLSVSLLLLNFTPLFIYYKSPPVTSPILQELYLLCLLQEIEKR